jgi:hypothetical protein
MACHDVEVGGGSVAAVMTDSITIPAAPEARLMACPGGPHRLPDGREAVRLLGYDEVRLIFGRFDKLFGRQAWKPEAGSLDRETWGLVAGVNKVVLGHFEGERFVLDRSSDTGLGDHFTDPTGVGARLPDGRLAWSAQLESALLARLVAQASGAAASPDDLPRWAEDRPAVQPGRATTMGDLRWLREQLGDPAVPPFARYVRAGGAVCLGAGRDPASWRGWPWCSGGRRCQVGVVLPDGEPLLSEEPPASKGVRTHQFFVPTMGEVLDGWLREHDPTVDGPKTGLRRVLAVRSHPALVHYVGRSGEAATGRDDALTLGIGDAGNLDRDAQRLPPSDLVARGVPRRTAMRVSVGKTAPRRPTVERLAAAVADGQPARACAGCGAELPPGSRAGRRWCSEACRKAAARGRPTGRSCRRCGASLDGRGDKGYCNATCRKAAERARRAGSPKTAAPAQAPAPASEAPATQPELLDRALSLLAGLPGLPEGALPALRRSAKLRGLLAEALPTVTAEALAERVGAEGPFRGESPVGILVSRLAALVPAMVAEAAEKRAAQVEGHRAFGARLARMQQAGLVDESTAWGELRTVTDPELRRAALDGYAAGLGLVQRQPEGVLA